MARIEQMVGRSGRSRDPVRARVFVHGEAGGIWRGEVELAAEGAREVRNLDGTSCRQVADAIVVMISMVAAADPAGVPPSLPTPGPPARPPSALPQPRGNSRAARVKDFGVGLAGAIDVGTLPSTALGGEVRFDWERARTDIGLAVEAMSSKSATPSTLPGQGASFWLVRVRIRGCYPMLGATLAAGPCAGLGAEAVVANGFHTARDSSVAAWIASPSLGAQVVLRLTSALSFRVLGEAMAAFPQSRFVILDYHGPNALTTTVQRVAPVAFGATAGGEFHF
jgi:hypothetical protein